MATDWSGRKYRVLQALGENIDMICGIYRPETREMQWFLHSHEVDDGYGAMVKILARAGVTIAPRLRAIPPRRPSLLQQLKALKLHVHNSRRVDYHWRARSESPNGPEPCLVHVLLKQEHGQQIRQHARKLGVGETALLLASLDRMSRASCLKHDSTRVWLLPHDVRRTLGVSATSGNWTAPVSLRLEKNATAHAIYGQLKALYAQRILWGSWLYTNFARWLSEDMIQRAYTRIKGRAWIGVFANMGHWRAPTVEPHPLAGAWIVSAPPASAVCPVTAGSFNWEGRMGLTLQLHTSLGANGDACMTLMRDWIADIYREVGIAEATPEPQCTLLVDIQRQACRIDMVSDHIITA